MQLIPYGMGRGARSQKRTPYGHTGEVCCAFLYTGTAAAVQRDDTEEGTQNDQSPKARDVTGLKDVSNHKGEPKIQA